MNMKKLLKSLLAIAAAFLMVFSFGTAVNAYDNNLTSITVIDNGGAGSTYNAYKLLSLTTSGTGNDTKYSYTINSKYSGFWSSLKVTTNAQAVSYFEKIEDNSTDMRIFADAAARYIRDNSLSADADATMATDATNVVIDNHGAGIEQGYYLVTETRPTSTTTDTETDTLAIVNTAGSAGVTVTAKEDVPSVQKKVKEVDDTANVRSDWQDAADFDVNDSIDFQLTGSLPSDYANYDKYYYSFVDTLSKGLQYTNDKDLHVYIVNNDNRDEVETGLFTVTEPKYNGTDDSTLTVTFANLKADNLSKYNITKDSKIVVEYKAQLTKNSVIGSDGNPNKVKLQYSNNPYEKGDVTPHTSETPQDTVIVFTYKTIFSKVDKDKKLLKGAHFELQKNENGIYTKVGEYTDDNNDTFEFDRLDSGSYRLVETQAPAGYHKISDIDFTIDGEYQTKVNGTTVPKFTSLNGMETSGTITIDGMDTAKADPKDGSISANIVNTSDSVLPTTGGIGTTMFYVVGGSLVAIAAVLLISKKRASAE